MYFLPWDEHFQFSVGVSKLGHLVERFAPSPPRRECELQLRRCFLTHETWKVGNHHVALCDFSLYNFTIQPLSQHIRTLPSIIGMVTLLGTNISHQQWHFEDDFPFPQVGYGNSLEGIHFTYIWRNK